MIIYRIKNWDSVYENNRTRELKNLGWIPLPLGHDGDGYTTLMSHENGAALFGAWIAVIQVAAKCDPRGTLVRKSQIPHSSATLSRITRIQVRLLDEMLDVCLTECNWLEIIDLQFNAEIPHDNAGIPHGVAPSCDPAAPRARAGALAEQNRTEGNRKEGNEHTEARGRGDWDDPPSASAVFDFKTMEWTEPSEQKSDDDPAPRSNHKPAPPILQVKETICAMHGRDPSAPWGNDEEHYLVDVSKRPSVLSELQEIHRFYQTGEKRYLPQSVRTLLQGFTGVLDRARMEAKEDTSKSKPKTLLDRQIEDCEKLVRKALNVPES